MQKNSHKRKLAIKVSAIIFEIIVLLTAVAIFASAVLGWFVSFASVSGNGMGVQLKVSGYFQIRAEESGEDIGVSAIDEHTTSIEFPDMEKKELYPGVSGRITFYVHDGSSASQNAYSFGYRITPKNDEWCGDVAYDNGFFAGLTEEEKALALKYMSSHIMFFESYDGDKYSGWISPESYVKKEVASAETATPYKVSVYWIWVPNYEDIFASPSAVLEENTRAEIATYYTANPDKLFSKDENSSDSFDGADTVIGISIKYMCFVIEVTSNNG
ncbi:MAG: hypothetical protein ACI4MS_04635 [Candidatus Coproplasma sp.]